LDAHIAKDSRRDPISFSDEAEEEVFSPDVVVVEPLGFFLGER
jgi:hypothetical protein